MEIPRKLNVTVSMTESTQYSPSSEANSRSASQNFSDFYYNLKFISVLKTARTGPYLEKDKLYSHPRTPVVLYPF